MKTIQLGIDLGTTNSAIAVVQDHDIQIVKNNLGEETTPSVIYADKSGTLIIGSKAKRKVLEGRKSDAGQNSKSEIKRLMGTKEQINFPHYGRPLSPEEISAEILKSMKVDVERKFPNIDTSAAVITVPAHFSTVQSEATKRAGALAGFSQVILLQEPIAAAISYGLTVSTNENWIVFDFGGGTFDVALVASHDGHLTVLAHGGDNFLGGKDIDMVLVDDVILPQLKRNGVSDFPISDGYFQKKIRAIAEQAKIELSILPKISCEISWNGASGDELECTVDISVEQLNAVCEKIFKKTLDICKKTISSSKIDPSSIKKIVLVGGPTQMPMLREYLKKELRMHVDGSLDPLTVVAKGAALFAKQTPLTKVSKQAPTTQSENVFKVELNYSHVTSEDAQTLTGRISVPDQRDKTGAPYAISFQSEDKTYSSGDLILKNDKFICQIPTSNFGNRFWIYLKTKSGDLLECDPDHFSVSKGVSITGAPIPHSIGVSITVLSPANGFADENETMDFFFPKNSLLPLKTTKRFQTANELQVGSTENALPICIYEGESNNPSRNTLICSLALNGSMISKRLKMGSPVDITISVDESRAVTVTAYLPDIDISLKDTRATLHAEDVNVDDLKKTLSSEVKRSNSVKNGTEEKNEIRDLIEDINSSISKSPSDDDQKRKASKQIKDLMQAIDESEAKSSFEKNCVEFYRLSDEVSGYILEANPPEKRIQYSESFQALKTEGTSAMTSKDSIALKQSVDKLNQFHWTCLFNDPVFLMGVVQDIKKNNPNPKSPIKEILVKADRATDSKDFTNLREAVIELCQKTSTSQYKDLSTLKSGITR